MTQIIDKAWSDVQPPDKVRFRTPRFIKYGTVTSHKDRSLTFWCEDELRDIVLPDGRWYFVQGKMYGPSAEECLHVIDELPEKSTRVIPTPKADPDVWVSVAAACEIIGMDPKQLRRHIRRGVVIAHKDQFNQWRVNREELRDTAAKYGWI